MKPWTHKVVLLLALLLALVQILSAFAELADEYTEGAPDASDPGAVLDTFFSDSEDDGDDDPEDDGLLPGPGAGFASGLPYGMPGTEYYSSGSSSYGWGYYQPTRRKSSHAVESIVSFREVKGTGRTTKANVNVRSQASVYSSRATRIRALGTLVTITAEAVNSSGQKWYAVQLSSGVLGYIRGDLLYAEIEEIIPVVTPSPEPEITPQVIYITPEPTAPQPTPTPIIIYITPEPADIPEITPQIIYIYEEENG